MKIVIHRGIDQIGGCITEVSTHKTRILIDLGQNLPDGDGIVHDNLASRESVEKITRDVDAIFYTHYHGDHIGLFHLVPEGIPQYIGGVAKLVTIRKHFQLAYLPAFREEQELAISKLAAMHYFIGGQRITVGDISVTPYFVSHSACDAFMFLIEGEGKRVLHTGDFRGHGYLSKGTIPTIKKLILPHGAIDFLITEGTLLSRAGERVKTEYELQKQIAEVMKQYKYVFAMCSSTDIERLATFNAANKRMPGRLLVCDGFQKDVLQIFADTKGAYTALFRFGKIFSYSPSATLNKMMCDRGFCMFVRASISNKFVAYLNYLLPQLDPKQTLLIYSMWGEYINPKGEHAKPLYLNFIKHFPAVEKIHTSGHASPEYLAEICNQINPTLGIIPIHSEQSDNYRQLNISDMLKDRIITRSQAIGGVDVVIKNPLYRSL